MSDRPNLLVFEGELVDQMSREQLLDVAYALSEMHDQQSVELQHAKAEAHRLQIEVWRARALTKPIERMSRFPWFFWLLLAK